MKTRITLLLAALVCPSQLPAQAPGSLDKTFQAQLPTNFASFIYYPLAAQPDGKIVVGGICSDAHFGPQFLARLNTDGTLDASFNASGIRCDGGDLTGYLASIALQSDGKIVLGGRSWEVPEHGQFALARLNRDGSVDGTFVPATGSYVSKLVTLPGGGCLMRPWGGVLRRLKPNGELDSTFSPQFPGAASIAVQDFAVQPDGRIVLALYPRTLADGEKSEVIRVLPDGSYDPSFEPALTDRYVGSVEILPDGKIFLGAFSFQTRSDIFSTVNGIARPGLARLQADGRLDLDCIPFADDLNTSSLAIQHDGKIILPQYWKVTGNPTRQLARLNTDGSRDETYVSELRQLRDGFDDFQILDMVLQPDDKLVVSIQDRSDDGTPFGTMIRLHGDGVPYIVPTSIRANSNRTVEFQITAATNRTVVVESSANLKSGPWTMLATFPPGVGRETIQFSDSGAANMQQRFYRAVSP
ncbi:MAG: hypothetical protein L0Z50_35525 [Verrucomicrobiales bacterium]|nr:hypothetical protein [Verrucomicrobiales bacterium]